MAIYYHVSTNIYHNGVFEPRIPQYRHKEQEDDKICRVSVAPTIEDCLTAIPNGGSRLEEFNEYQRGYYLIFKIDTDKLGIQEEYIIQSEFLYEKDLVRDADVTNEIWITTSFVVPEEDRFLIHLSDWMETPLDILPYSIYAIADEKFEGDYLRAYCEVYNELVPCSVGITNPNYICEFVRKGQIISLYIEEEYEKVEIFKFLTSNYNVDIVDENEYKIEFIMKEDSNLKNLFYYHKKIAVA